MIADQVTTRWTGALFNLAKRHAALDEVQRDVESLGNEIASPAVQEFLFSAQVVNSRATHTLLIDAAMYALDTPLPGVPTNAGTYTVNPRSTTSSANCTTDGVTPGISCTTTTAGPLPFRNTSRAYPAASVEPPL